MRTSKAVPQSAILRPCVLAIGGLDPGGGAGVLADARAILRANAFAAAAIAVMTVQSTSGLRRATPVDARELRASCTEVLRHQRVRAFKVGALGSLENVRTVGRLLARHSNVPAVVDTVMIPTRGRARLLHEEAVFELKTRLLPHAALVTVNAPEAAALTGQRVRSMKDARVAVEALLACGARAVLLKAGHLEGEDAADLLAIADAERLKCLLIRAPRLPLPPFHGGGCVLASLIAGRLAVNENDVDADFDKALVAAVRWSKRVHYKALCALVDVGGSLPVVVP
jgi:hydroxymethylpyrimidine/phosphomethylpyrimidine kinase